MFKLKDETRVTKIILFTVLSIFIVICIATSLYYGDKLLLGSLESFDNDDVKYLRSAQTFLDTGKLTYNYPDKQTVFIMPGIILILAPFVRFFGLSGGAVAFRIFSAFVQAGSLLLLFFIVRRLFNKNIALLAIILNAIYIPNIYVTTLALTETIFTFFFFLMIYMTICGLDCKKTKYYIAGGLFWGICALFRPTITAYPFVVLVMWLINKYSFKEIVKFTLVTCGVFIIVMMPWWIRNGVVFKQFIPFTMASGNPALQGTYIGYEKIDINDEPIDISDIKWGDDELINDKAEREIAKRRFNYYIKEKPIEYIRWYTVGKTIKNIELPFIWFPLYGLQYTQIFSQHWIFLLVGFLGIVMFFFYTKNRNKNAYLLMLLILLFDFVHLPFYCFPRYMYPVMPFVITFAAFIIINTKICVSTLLHMKTGD